MTGVDKYFRYSQGRVTGPDGYSAEFDKSYPYLSVINELWYHCQDHYGRPLWYESNSLGEPHELELTFYYSRQMRDAS